MLCLFSCGLKYIPKESPEQLETRRHQVIENYIKNEYSEDSLHYKSIAFGPSKIIKPETYQRLDSLYEIKYDNEKKGKVDHNLEILIENQRNIALSDTNKVMYVENHFFSHSSKDTITYYNSFFRLDHDLAVREVNIQESTVLPKKYEEEYKIYLFEESFLNPGYLATSEEQSFYSLFKDHTSGLAPEPKEKFIVHTLNIMNIASNAHTLRTETILTRLVTKKYIGNSYSDKYETKLEFSQVTANTAVELNSIIGYIVLVSFKDPDNPELPAIKYELEFDKYLQLTKETKL